ncbi:hypothetical protein Peur_028664 [Populus x canadensis]
MFPKMAILLLSPCTGFYFIFQKKYCGLDNFLLSVNGSLRSRGGRVFNLNIHGMGWSKDKIEDIINYEEDEVRFVKLSWKISTEDDYDIDPHQFPEYASPGLGSLVLPRKD